MSMYEDDYDEEESEREPEENAETKTDGAKITITMETEILKRTIVDELHAELLSSLRASIISDIKAEILPPLKEEIVKHTREIVMSLIDDIYKNDKITIGGGWDEKRGEVTFEEFVRREIKTNIQSGKFKGRDGYSTDFSDYFTKQCVGSEIERFMQTSVDEIRKDINAKMKTLFDTQTKTMLSDTVLNVLMASETYQGIENSVKRLADKSEGKK